MPPLIYLFTALIYDFLCLLAITVHVTSSRAEHVIWGNLNLCFQATVTNIWLINKLFHIAINAESLILGHAI